MFALVRRASSSLAAGGSRRDQLRGCAGARGQAPHDRSMMADFVTGRWTAELEELFLRVGGGFGLPGVGVPDFGGQGGHLPQALVVLDRVALILDQRQNFLNGREAPEQPLVVSLIEGP